LIQRGAADAVLVVGVDLLSHFVLAGFTSLKSLDPEGCRPFDRARVGLSVGEAAAAMVLVRPELGSSRSWQVTGWGSSNDANHLTGPSRDGSGLALAMERALGVAGMPAGSVAYLHAHGTGTPYNDAMESHAFRRVFGESTPPFGSSKGLFGHTLGAAGILETVFCVTALDAGLLPGTPRLSHPDPIVPSTILKDPRPAGQAASFLKVNCGFGGTNAALVLEKRGGRLLREAEHRT
jgi:3-oxoacyl-[acyl-carrier-protein] synthase II